VDSIYPNTPEALERRKRGVSSDLPFLPAARVHVLAAPPDHLVAGDFDGDGVSDVVVGSEGGHAVSFLSGDGTGGLAPAVGMTLP
jgi:hypothetical protein